MSLKKIGLACSLSSYILRTKSDCSLYHLSKVSAPLAGVQDGPEGNVSLEQRASFISTQAKILEEFL